MSAFALKLLALIAMIIDHIGSVFFPEVIILRYIGRLAMPIYAFLLVQGYRYTRSFGRYALRLALFAVLSEVPHDLLFRRTWLEFSKQNVLFTLFTALIVIRLLDLSAKNRNIFLFLMAAGLTIAPYFLHFEYNYYGVLMVLCFYLFRKYRGLDVAAFSGLTYVKYMYDGNETQLWAIAAGLPILLYNGKKGAFSLKYVFYFAYPVHLLILYGVRYLLDNNLLIFA